MNPRRHEDLSQLSMLDLFRVETETQVAILTSGLLELERAPAAAQPLETLMRAAHSVKGAARIVNLNGAVRLAHAMEDCFVAAQHRQLRLDRPGIDVLLRGVDLLANLAKCAEADIAGWEGEHAVGVGDFLSAISGLLAGCGSGSGTGSSPVPESDGAPPSQPQSADTAPRQSPEETIVRAPASPAPETGGESLPALPASRTENREPVSPDPSRGVSARRAEPPERVVRLTAASLCACEGAYMAG